MQSEFENLLLDTQKEYSHSNRTKDKMRKLKVQK